MRVAWVVAMLCLSACASEKLSLAPPQGVNFSGQWRLDEADSDDPVRVAMSQNAAAAAQNGTGSGGQGGQGGPGGRGGRGNRGAPGGYGSNGPTGPTAPGIGVLSDGLHWPGKELTVQQTGGVVTISSAGFTQVYRPSAGGKPGPAKPDDAAHGGRGRERIDTAPPVCGWDDRTLVVTSDTADDTHPPFEQRYSLAEGGERLIEVVAFNGGRSGGFTVSRVWERVP